MSFIMDNLISEKKAVPMIIVMDNGYATAKDAPASPVGTATKDRSRMAETLEKVYTKEIIPETDSYYRTIPKRESRAMAGLSMGGMQTMLIGLNHIELFSHYGFFSGAILGGIMDDPKTAFNGVFADPGERVLGTTDITTASPPQSPVTSLSVTVPAGATLGTTKMRVAMVIGTPAQTVACNTVQLSDSEDYDIDVLPAFSFDAERSAEITLP